jgi:hypothetical protein
MSPEAQNDPWLLGPEKPRIPGLVKLRKNDGKSPCFMGKSSINGPFFKSYVKLPERSSR